MIIALVSLAIMGYLFYWAFIQGNAWGILLFIGGIYGIKTVILSLFPQAIKTFITIATYEFSIATCIATLVCLLGVAFYLKEY